MSANRIVVIKNEEGRYVEREFCWRPTAWQLQGLHETATGYGARLNSGYKVHYAGKLRRVYAVCYSNCASYYVLIAGARVFLGV